MANEDRATVGEIVDVIRRTQASIREEGQWAHRADDLCVVVRPDGALIMKLIPRGDDEALDPVFAKALSLDPLWHVAPREDGTP